MRNPVVDYITQYAHHYGVDPRAALAVARTEGGLRWGAVGDQGTSFGPFQLHVGGALPRGRNAAWANSEAGIAYAIRKMAESGARGLMGEAAINSIVRRFERPADPDAQVAKAMGYYGGAAPSMSGTPDDMGAAQPAMASPAPAPAQPAHSALLGIATMNDPKAQSAMLVQALMQKPQQIMQQQPQTPSQPSQPAAVTPMGDVNSGNVLPSSFTSTHQTSGLEGYPALDWMRPAGTVAGAPVNGVVTRISGGKGTRGKGIYGYNLYITGDDGSQYFLTHFGDIAVRPGQRIAQGQPLGTVADYGKADHIHIGRRR